MNFFVCVQWYHYSSWWYTIITGLKFNVGASVVRDWEIHQIIIMMKREKRKKKFTQKKNVELIFFTNAPVNTMVIVCNFIRSNIINIHTYWQNNDDNQSRFPMSSIRSSKKYTKIKIKIMFHYNNSINVNIFVWMESELNFIIILYFFGVIVISFFFVHCYSFIQ